MFEELLKMLTGGGVALGYKAATEDEEDDPADVIKQGETDPALLEVQPEEAEASRNKATDDGSLDFVLDALGTREFAPILQLEAAIAPESEIGQRSQVKPIRLHSDDELATVISIPEHPNYANARNEIMLRSRWSKQSLIENLSDPDYVARHSRDLADQFVAGIPRIPGDIMMMGGMITAIPGALGSDIGKETTQEILQTGEEYYGKINEIMQTHEPQNPAETLASIGPGAAARIPLKLGGGLPRSIAEVVTPFTIGGGAGRQAANVGVQFAATEAIRTAVQDERDTYETVFSKFLSPSDAIAQSADEGLDFNPQAQPNDDINFNFKIGETPDGTPIKNEDLSKLGYLGLGTLALAVAPGAVRFLAKKVAKDPTRIADPTGLNFPSTLETSTLPRDVLLTEIADPVRGMTNSAARAGIDLGDFRASAEMSTSASLANRIGESMVIGKLETYEGVSYNTKTTVDTVVHHYDVLDDATKKAAKDYADMMHRIDWMTTNQKPAFLNTSMRQAQKAAADIKRAYPFVDALQKGYQRTIEAMRDFHSSGEYATLTKSSATQISKNHHPRVLDPELYGSAPLAKDRWATPKDMPPANAHVSPYETLKMWTEQLMRDRILNSVRGTFVDKVRAQSGDRFIHKLPANKKQRDALLRRHKKWKKWMVSFKRRGVEEFYVTNPLWHDVLRFDPNYQRHAFWNSSSRLFQFWTTSYGNPAFAVTRFVRDPILANQATPEGLHPLGVKIGEVPIPVPGAIHTHAALAVGETLFRKGQLALAQKFRRAADTPGDNWLKNTFGESALRARAMLMADSYQKSTYHAVMGSGGADVSYSQHSVQAAKTKVRDFLNSKAPESVKAFGHAYANIIDAMQNAGVTALSLRNVRVAQKKKGAVPLKRSEIDEILSKTKPVTGDVTVAGRSFVREGVHERTFGITEQGATGLARGGDSIRSILNKTATATQAIRESVPFSNAVVQSSKSIAMAYWKNPYRFMTKLWVYVGIPQLASFTTTGMLDAANGDTKYQDYLFEGRSEYDKSTKVYFPIPGLPPDQGLEIPVALEIAPIGYMFLNSLDWMLRHGKYSPHGTDAMLTIGKNFFGLTMPPVISTGMASQGIKVPGTIPGFGEQAYEPKPNEYGALPMASKALTGKSSYGANLELMIRQQFGAAGTTFIGMVNAFATEKDILAAIKEGAYQLKQQTPIVKQAKRGTFTAINQANLRQKDKMSEYELLHKVWIKHGGKVRSSAPGGAIPGRLELSGVDERPPGMVKKGTLDLSSRPFINPEEAVKAAPYEIDGKIYLIPLVKENMTSMLTKTGKIKGGKDAVKYYKNNNYGVFDSEASASAYLNQLENAEVEIETLPMDSFQAQRVFKPEVPPPTNWLYIYAADMIHEAFEQEGLGFANYTKALKEVTEGVKELRRADSGALGEFKTWLAEMEEGNVKDYLKDIDPTNRNDVQKAINLLEERRNPILKQIERHTKETENRISRRLSEIAGKEIKIDLLDLDPYGEPPIPEPSEEGDEGELSP